MLREAHLGIQNILVRLAIYYYTVLLQTQYNNTVFIIIINLRTNLQYI